MCVYVDGVCVCVSMCVLVFDLDVYALCFVYKRNIRSQPSIKVLF